MSININQSSSHKKPGIGEVLLGVYAGSCVNELTKTMGKVATSELIKTRNNNIINPLTDNEMTEIKKGITKAFNESGLAKKGVGILYANKNNSKEVGDIIRNNLNKSILKYIKTPHSIEKQVTKSCTAIINGKNAQYINTTKKILLPESKLQLAFFHEAGHALNANMGTMTKVLQKSRMLGLLVIPISLIALFKNKKEEGEKPKGFLDKATDFIKNNAGKLTFAALIPKLSEEGIASLKGNKMAKSVLDADLAKKVAKSNAYAFASYVTFFTFGSFGIFLATKVRDKIVSGDKVNTNKETTAEKIVSADTTIDKNDDGYTAFEKQTHPNGDYSLYARDINDCIIADHYKKGEYSHSTPYKKDGYGIKEDKNTEIRKCEF